MSAASFVLGLVKLSQQDGEYTINHAAAAAIPAVAGLGGAALGAGYGALTSPSAEDRLEAVLRGAVLGGGTFGGMGLGAVGGAIAGHTPGEVPGSDRSSSQQGAQMGSVAGGYIGNLIGEGLLGRPSWERDDGKRRREKHGSLNKRAEGELSALDLYRRSLMAAATPAVIGAGALGVGAYTAPRGREWHGAGSTYAQTAGTLGGAGLGAGMGALGAGVLGGLAMGSPEQIRQAMLAGGTVGGLGGGYAGNRLMAALSPGPQQLGLGDRDGDERRREKQGSVKLANIPQLSSGPPELPRRPAPMPQLDESSAVSALAQLSAPEYSPYAEFESPKFKPKPMDAAYATSAYGKPIDDSIGPVPMGAGYSPYASIERPEFKPKLPELPMGERTWQQFGQGIGNQIQGVGKHIYNNPTPYALGAGAAGLGLYGLHNMMQRPRRKRRYEEE